MTKKVYYASVTFPADYRQPHMLCETSEANAKRGLRSGGRTTPKCRAWAKGPTCKAAKAKARAAVMRGCSRKKCPAVTRRFIEGKGECVVVRRGRKREIVGCRPTFQAAEKLIASTRRRVCK